MEPVLRALPSCDACDGDCSSLTEGTTVARAGKSSAVTARKPHLSRDHCMDCARARRRVQRRKNKALIPEFGKASVQQRVCRTCFTELLKAQARPIRTLFRVPSCRHGLKTLQSGPRFPSETETARDRRMAHAPSGVVAHASDTAGRSQGCE